MLNAAYLTFANFRAFWSIRAKLRRVGFLFRRGVFSAKQHLEERRTRTATFVELAMSTLKPLLISLFLVSSLQAVNPWLETFYNSTGLSIHTETYSTFLATVAATGGVLIGLYYAATTAIAGAIYSNVPNNIRDLLARDRVGNIYMSFLSFITFTSIALLAMKSAGFAPISLAAVFLLVSAGVSIIAFVKLGARAFYLFDPTTMSGELVQEVKDSYHGTRPGHYRWDDSSFQNFAYRKARLAIETTKTLAQITSKEAQLSGQPLLTLCAQLLYLLRNYEAEKKAIPTDSQWYPRKYIHADWYATEDMKTSMAHQSSGRLDPKEISDSQWLESEILPIIHLCFRVNVEAGRHDLVLNLTQLINGYAHSLAAEHDVKLAMDMVNQLTVASSPQIFAKRRDESTLEPVEQLALIDSIASIPITIFLAYVKAVKSTARHNIASAIQGIHWDTKAEIYNSDLPRHIIPQLEWMYPRVEFERRTEGHKLSPDWYLTELAVQTHLQNLKDNLTTLVQDAQSLFDLWIGLAEASNLSWARADVLTREAEYWSKVRYQFHVLRRQCDELNADRRIDGLPWASIDLDETENSIDARRKLILRRMAEEVPVLSVVTRPDEYPDFAGQFLHTVGESLISALIENDVDLFKEVFPSFFISSFMQHDRIGKNANAAKWQPEVIAKVSVAPVLDLMSLSGYGLLMAELHDNAQISSAIVDLWNTFLDERKANENDLIPFLTAAISITDMAFELAHRSLIRSQWNQRISNRLRDVPRKSVLSRGSFMISRTVAIHKSPLVRLMAVDQFMSLYNGIDIFVEMVLRKRASKDHPIKSRRDLSRALDREARRKNDEHDADQGEAEE